MSTGRLPRSLAISGLGTYVGGRAALRLLEGPYPPRIVGIDLSVPKALVPLDRRVVVPDLLYPNGPCLRPAMRLIVQYDGTVCNCCEDTSGVFELGNVNHASVEEIWYSERHVRIVTELGHGERERYPLCGICPLSPSEAPPNGARLRIHPRRSVDPIRR